MTKRHNQIKNLWNKQQGICHYCDRLTFLDVPKNHPLLATKEHIFPRSFGGPDAMKNFVMVCSECNHKRDRTLLYCKCVRCSEIIKNSLTDEFINLVFVGMCEYNRPVIRKTATRKSKYPWLVQHLGTKRSFKTWQQAMDYVNIVAVDSLAMFG